MKDQHTDWSVHSTIVDSLSCTIKDLQPGRAYRFRVRAENCHGCSEPSSPTDEVCIRWDAHAAHAKTGNTVDADRCQAASDAESPAEPEHRPPSVREGGDFKARFETFEELGKGRFGVVYRCVERETGTLLAAKIVKCIRSADKTKVRVLMFFFLPPIGVVFSCRVLLCSDSGRNCNHACASTSQIAAAGRLL